MAACPNCGRQTLRTKDWACQWCGYPLISRAFKIIDKTYKELQEERSLGPMSTDSDADDDTAFEPEYEAEPEPEPEPKRKQERKPERKSERKPEPEPEPEPKPKFKFFRKPQPTPPRPGIESMAQPEPTPTPVRRPTQPVRPVYKPEPESTPPAPVRKPEPAKPVYQPPPTPPETVPRVAPSEPASGAGLQPVQQPSPSPAPVYREEPKPVAAVPPAPIPQPPAPPSSAPKPEIVVEHTPPPVSAVKLEDIKDGMEISADDLDALFRSDKAGTNIKLNGKSIVLKGIVEKVFIREHLDIRYIVVKGARKSLWSARCTFDKENAGKASHLNEGAVVAVRSKYDGYGKNIIFKDCAVI